MSFTNKQRLVLKSLASCTVCGLHCLRPPRTRFFNRLGQCKVTMIDSGQRIVSLIAANSASRSDRKVLFQPLEAGHQQAVVALHACCNHVWIKSGRIFEPASHCQICFLQTIAYFYFGLSQKRPLSLMAYLKSAGNVRDGDDTSDISRWCRERSLFIFPLSPAPRLLLKLSL